MYAARLARLERLVGKGERNCPRCRLYRRHVWADSRKPIPTPRDPSLVGYHECPMCGEKKRRDLSALPGRLGELVVIIRAARPEDFYRDERAWAARQWSEAYLAAMKASSAQQRDHAMRKAQGPPPPRRPKKRKDGPEKKLYDKLLAESDAHARRTHVRLAAQYGEDPFPELTARLAAVKHTDREYLYKGEPFARRVSWLGMYYLEQEEAAWLKCAEAETIVLGEALASTLEEIEDCGRRALEIIDEARREHEEHEEKERRRREEDERRHREYLESIRAAPAAPPERVFHRGAHSDPPRPPSLATPSPPKEGGALAARPQPGMKKLDEARLALRLARRRAGGT
jgi:hypothetical protein